MMIKFGSIEQFRSTIKAVEARTRWAGVDENGDAIFDRTRVLPTLAYKGTVKLHGTNASFVYDVATDTISYQSRERVLSLTQDNAGFMLFMMQHEPKLKEIAKTFLGGATVDKVVVYGEWCGGSIQKGVAISGLPKMFVIFACKLRDGVDTEDDVSGSWVSVENFVNNVDHDINIYNIHEFQTFTLDIDFENPHEAQNKMIAITEQVETECPVGKHFGRVFGTYNSTGEGVVWKPVDPTWSSQKYMFKVKGCLHSASRVKTLAAVDVDAINSLKEFVESTVTENRMEQMLDVMQREKMLTFDMKNLGEFIRLVYNDVVKEESDTIIENQFDPKKLGGPIADVARKWYITKYNAQ